MQNKVLKSKAALTNELLDEASMEFNVKRSIAMHTEFRFDQIITQSNVEKYFDRDNPESENEYLNEIFEAMSSLNKEGVNSPTLGATTPGGTHFSAALSKACFWFSKAMGNTPIVYVELGPEPVKTRHIIKNLLERGVKIDRYIAVDVNPASGKYMRAALGDLLHHDQMSFVTSAFEEFSLANYLEGSTVPALVTMLGFQEGNDDPEVMTRWLSGIARPGDYLISEVQLYSFDKAEKISSFYSHPLMQRFSRLAFEQTNGPTLSSNRFFLLPVEARNKDRISMAILAEEFIEKDIGRRLFVSNFCLKFDREQYSRYRQAGNRFRVLREFGTEDETLLFQISQRCLNE